MVAMKLPHTIDHYAVSTSSNDGAAQRSYPATPTQGNIACMVQPQVSEVDLTAYKQRKEFVIADLYMTDGDAFAQIQAQDRIVWKTTRYHVTGRGDLSGVGKVFHLTLKQESY